MFRYIETGEILKPFRTEGELLALIKEGFEKDVENAKAIFLRIKGSMVPFFIETIDFDKNLSYIKFEEFSGPEDIKKFNGTKLFLREQDIKFAQINKTDDEQDFSQFYIVDLATKRKFKIIKTQQFPQQLMAIIEVDNTEKLIPLIEQFIDKIDKQNKEILMTLPENLI